MLAGLLLKLLSYIIYDCLISNSCYNRTAITLCIDCFVNEKAVYRTNEINDYWKIVFSYALLFCIDTFFMFFIFTVLMWFVFLLDWQKKILVSY